MTSVSIENAALVSTKVGPSEESRMRAASPQNSVDEHSCSSSHSEPSLTDENSVGHVSTPTKSRQSEVSSLYKSAIQLHKKGRNTLDSPASLVGSPAKKGRWEEDEDKVLMNNHAKLGNCWTKISKLLPGRSENAVKNRWKSASFRRCWMETLSFEDDAPNPRQKSSPGKVLPGRTVSDHGSALSKTPPTTVTSKVAPMNLPPVVQAPPRAVNVERAKKETKKRPRDNSNDGNQLADLGAGKRMYKDEKRQKMTTQSKPALVELERLRAIAKTNAAELKASDNGNDQAFSRNAKWTNCRRVTSAFCLIA
eukprot:scaffold205241_cov48-Attheya_sp.AAC.2